MMRNGKPEQRQRTRPPPTHVVTCLAGGLALWLHAGPAHAEAVVHLPFSAAAEDSFEVRITKFSHESRGDEENKDPPIIVVYDGEVMAATAAGYRITWQMGAFHMLGLAVADASEIAAVAALMQGIPLEFETDLAGTPVRLSLAGEVISRSIDALKSLEAFPAEVLDQTAAALGQLDAQTAAAVLLPEALLLASVQNKTYPTDRELVSEGLAPSPLGGQVRLVTRHRLESSDPVTGFAAVSWTTEFDPASLREATRAAFERFMPEDVESEQAEAMIEAMLAAIEIERRDTGLALISMDDGWVRKMHVEQRISARAPDMSNSKYESLFIEVDRK